MNDNIDQEWENFISVGYNETSDDDEDTEDVEENVNINFNKTKENVDSLHLFDMDSNAPKPTNIYISTKTKIAYLNTPIELKDIFWNIPVIPYAVPRNGVIKKQMKFNSLTPEELHLNQEKLKNETYFEEYVITHIDNPTGRIKFKDTRKISIGISKKDILSYRSKKKSAFYNCFVLILRMKVEATFKEFHVKVFNTGKLEIPGVQSEITFKLILQQVIDTIQPYMETKLGYKENSDETVLINSNFNCGYFINREALYDILKYKYNIQSIYDPCSYPGIQCKFYYNPDIGLQNGCQISEENKHLYDNVKEVSFMIFRTGSVLIVGRCDENVLFIIYDFLKNILNNEFKNICQKNVKVNQDGDVILKDKKKKVRRKNITIEMNCEL
jgi:hypothetical protein